MIRTPIPSAPLVDINTGNITREWLRFFTEAATNITSTTNITGAVFGGSPISAAGLDGAEDLDGIAGPQFLTSQTGSLTFTGDVTGTGETDSSTALTVANDAVSFAKMQNIATDSLIGRDTTGTGDPETILLNPTLSMDGAGNLQRAALTGAITASAGSNTTALGSFTSADLASALTDETGSGANVHATSPTLVTPVLGVASATSINFGQDALNYYDEGTFTPTFTFDTAGDISNSYATQNGNYTRIGDTVHFWGQLIWTPTYTTSAGNGRIGGLPFTHTSTGSAIVHVVFLAGGGSTIPTWTAGSTMIQGRCASSDTYFVVSDQATTTGETIWTTSIFTSGVKRNLLFNGCYRV